MESRFTRHFNIHNVPTNWVTDTEDSHADHSSEVGPLLVGDYVDWVEELWACYAGDDQPEEGARARFVEWIGEGGESVAAKIEWP